MRKWYEGRPLHFPYGHTKRHDANLVVRRSVNCSVCNPPRHFKRDCPFRKAYLVGKGVNIVAEFDAELERGKRLVYYITNGGKQSQLVAQRTRQERCFTLRLIKIYCPSTRCVDIVRCQEMEHLAASCPPLTAPAQAYQMKVVDSRVSEYRNRASCYSVTCKESCEILSS